MIAVQLLGGPFDGADTEVHESMYEIAMKVPGSLKWAVIYTNTRNPNRWKLSKYIKQSELKKQWALKPEGKK